MRKELLFIFAITVGIISMASSCSKEEENKGNEKPDDPTTDFIHGVDLSYIGQVEDHGGSYLEQGNQVDPYTLFSSKGANMVRLRLWHNPSWIKDVYDDETKIYSGLEEVAAGIQRAKDNDMAVNLDFHYSDIWADPNHQDPPAAWADVTNIDVLSDSVYNYTYKVLTELQARNLLPEMVQIGNETNCGMMMTNTKADFPKLSVCDGHWGNFGKILNAGIKAVRDVDALSGQSTQIVLHVADPKNLDWWFTNVISQGKVTDFDVAGFSYYHIWHTTVSFNELPGTVSALKTKINKDIAIVETAYPFTTANNDTYNNIYGSQAPISGYPYTVEGQKQFMIDLTQNMMDAGAIGVMYWEPAWITSQMKDLWGNGSAWENCAVFDFSENVTEAINYLNHDYSIGE